jgi:hypothetical protein
VNFEVPSVTEKSPVSRPKPVGFRQAACLVMGLIVGGYALEWLTGSQGITPPKGPTNLALLAALVIWLAVLGLVFPEHRWVAGLAGIPMSLCLLTAMTGFGLLIGWIPQDPTVQNHLIRAMGWTHVTTSWPFIMTYLLLLTHLGLALLRRGISSQKPSTQFLVHHGGLWLLLACAFFGAGDVQRYRLTLSPGQTAEEIWSESGQRIRLPFRIQLVQFILDEYPPFLLVFDGKSPANGARVMELVGGARSRRQDLDFEVMTFLEHGCTEPGGVRASRDPLDPPFAQIRVRDSQGHLTEGWITRGNSRQPPRHLSVGGQTIAMTKERRPRQYRSEIICSWADGRQQHACVAVNQPVSVGGWQLYQSGYDEIAENGARRSLFEVVRDPWLPGVYAGIFMIFLSTLTYVGGGLKNLWRVP